MTGKKGKSGRKPSPGGAKEYIQIRVTKEQRATIEKMAEASQAGTISAVIKDLIDTQTRISQAKKSAGSADIWQADK